VKSPLHWLKTTYGKSARADLFERGLSTGRRESQKVVLSGVGEIRKADGSQFKRMEIKPILEALRIFLSFAFAEWSPPLLVVGSNDVAEKSCQFWGNYDVSPRPYLRGWLDEHHGQHLADAFPGFMARWSHENWQATGTGRHLADRSIKAVGRN
jgi:hypothetical protein